MIIDSPKRRIGWFSFTNIGEIENWAYILMYGRGDIDQSFNINYYLDRIIIDRTDDVLKYIKRDV